MPKNKQLYQPFEILVSDMPHWKERPLVYQFFEIVQIIEGEGMRIVNENSLPYRKGSVFLFTPLDCRGFESTKPTRFCSLRFSEIFLERYKGDEERLKVLRWLKQLEAIFSSHNRLGQVMVKNGSDCQMVQSLLGFAVIEYDRKQASHNENLQYLVTLILNIIARNVIAGNTNRYAEKAEEPLINKMLIHIRQHIHQPEKLRVKYLAAQFHLSASYTGEYFKKLTGDSLYRYISQYKMNVIQDKLCFSQLSVGQIAGEFGYADESHFSRQFKKYTGTTPAEYKKQRKISASVTGDGYSAF